MPIVIALLMAADPVDPLAQQIVTFLLGGGALAMAGMIGRAFWKWRTGRMAEQKSTNTTLVDDRARAIIERRQAEKERDAADAKRRRAYDEVGRLRVLLIQNGIDPGDEPDFEQTAQRRKAPTERPREIGES